MAQLTQTNQPLNWFRRNSGVVWTFLALAAFPFVVALLSGQPLGEVLTNEQGNAKFLQGLMIEICILAVYALSYDLVLGITGLLSFGHAMFFGVGAYATGIMLKTFDLGLGTTLLLVVVAGVIQAFIFGIVLPRVQGITFALVTLGMAAVFHIVIQSREMGPFTGADVGLQGVTSPAFISPSDERLRFYFVAVIFMLTAYLLYKRFVDSPTGRVCIAIRENEARAKMLGYNTFYFKLAALTVASITAALAGALHTLYSPIVSPNVASLAYTVSALLMILMGGVGTLSGALIGAGLFRLLEFGLDRYFGEQASFLIGVVYIGIVLYLPFGVVGTWQQRSADIQRGRERILAFFKSD
jgi:branched-chain amino acid transport system permease protein